MTKEDHFQQRSRLQQQVFCIFCISLSLSASPSGALSTRVTLRASSQRVLVAGEGALWLACEANVAGTTLSLVLLDRPEPTAPTAVVDKCVASLAIAHDTTTGALASNLCASSKEQDSCILNMQLITCTVGATCF